MLERIMIILLVLLSIWIIWYTWKNTRDITKLQRKLIKSNRLYYLCLKYIDATEDNNKNIMKKVEQQLKHELKEEVK